MTSHRRIQERTEQKHQEEIGRGGITSSNDRGMVGKISEVG